MKLTNEEKNKRIALHLGFTVVFNEEKQEHELLNPAGKWEYPYDADGSEAHCWNYAPNYFECLNACHEAEKCIEREQIPEWERHVRQITQRDSEDGTGLYERIIRATAAQRAEAFGLTLNLWEAGE